ncbi:hypothetical protein IWQ62_004817 [Dispira parvispora]|uniref:AB hydrolase-1 domain-containing protein n=1 Tax=Dispira parvispora TaxID=1520584 RepID=A0A9W8AP21_9FUNG|nr:hypothetical protein IWQ62_004817 [Dispira parvispora]
MSSQNASPDTLLLVFIHGFRGNDFTFKDFPERLRTVLTNSIQALDVESIVYPQYRTQGELHEATVAFCDWLVSAARDRRQAQGPNGRILVILVGHSMGGLLAADAVLHFHDKLPLHNSGPMATNSSDLRELDATVLGLVAYDTPFYGLNPSLITDTALQRASQATAQVSNYLPALGVAVPAVTSFFGSSQTTTARAAETSPSTGSKWSAGKWGALAVGGFVASAAAAAVTYSQREHIQKGYEYFTSHLSFVGALFRNQELHQRVDQLVALEEVVFCGFYVQLEKPTVPVRTFIQLPPAKTKHYFYPLPSPAEDEIEGHVTIFKPASNPHYYAMGDTTFAILIDAIKKHRESTK